MNNINCLKTPCYIINKDNYENNLLDFFNEFKKQWSKNVVVAYSVKTNNNKEIMKIAKKNGCYAEVVSSQEYDHALEVGFNSNKIIFNGPIKGSRLNHAIKNNCIVNLDSLDEVDYICNNAKKVKCRIGIRVNLDIQHYTKKDINFKSGISRFGICYENGELKKALDKLNNNGINISCLHIHYTSITRSKAFYKIVANKISKIINDYELHNIEYLDFGGGYFGGMKIESKPTYSDYAKAITQQIKKVINPNKTVLILEPGSSTLSISCDYLTSIKNCKKVNNKYIVTVDGTSLHINPFMKQKSMIYEIIGRKGTSTSENEQIVGGCTCLENDTFDFIHIKRKLNSNNKILIKNAGAYTMSLNSSFITDIPNIYLLSDGKYKLVRKNINFMSY